MLYPTATSRSATAAGRDHLRRENISSIEVEDALHRHAAVMLAAVVAIARRDARGGCRAPSSTLKPKAQAAASRDHRLLPHCWPATRCQTGVFGPLPKTSTGKIQKFVLRNQVKSASAIR